MASLGNLPEEVMIEILSRLPPESILRFKCVCKSWYAIINNPKFAIKSTPTTVLLKRLVTKDSDSSKKQNMFSFLKYSLPDHQVVDFDLPFDEDFQYSEFHGQSHSLVCLSDLAVEIFLCNPATREFHKLPPSILLLTEPLEEPDSYDSSTNAVGFGYDPRSRDFKVVRVVDFVEGAGYFHPPRVEVYNLSKDQWREIKTPVCGHVFWAPSFDMYHEGIYYGWADAKRRGEIIQSFDISEEVFWAILVPESFEQEGDEYRSMGVLKGSIVLFYHLPGADEKTFDIWVMEKDDSSGGVLWSKALTIGPVSGLVKPLVFVSSESDELLMEAKEGQVVLYNLNSGQVKELPVKGHPDRFPCYGFVGEFAVCEGRQ